MHSAAGTATALLVAAIVVMAWRSHRRPHQTTSRRSTTRPLPGPADRSDDAGRGGGRSSRLELAHSPTKPAPEPRLDAPVTLVGARFNAVYHGTTDDGRLSVRAATLRGHAHNFENRPGQDVAAATWSECRGSVFAVVADGIGSRPQSGDVAHLLVAQILLRVAELGPDDDPGGVVAASAEDVAHYVAREGLDGASTLLVAEINGDRVPAPAMLWGIGDSEAWSLIEGLWSPLYREASPDTGEATRCVPEDGAVHGSALTVPCGAVLVLATDGFARALGERNSPLSRGLADAWREPPGPSDFMGQVDFVHPYFNDDRSVVAVWVR